MRFLQVSVLLITIFTSIVACSSDNDTPQDEGDNFDRGTMLVNWADNIIIPAYTNFNLKATALEASTAQFTANPTAENLQLLRSAWKDSYVSFQNVSMFEIGKAEELRFRNRLNVYPANTDQIENFISSGDYDFALPSTIDKQGFPALDYMLNGLAENDTEIIQFYTTNANSEGYRNYLLALSESISSLSNAVLDSWINGYRDTFVANTSSSASGAVDKLTNDYIFYFEKSLRAGKVGIPAGVFSAETLPQNVEAYYKKDISKELLLEAIAASQNFFNGKSFDGNENGPGFNTYLNYLNTIKNGENLGDLINSQFAVAKTKANELNPNLAQQIETDNFKMLETYDELQRLVILMKVDMVQAFDVSIDYIDSDGD
ncbi:imelysin family protein [Aequorivita xiaoshiensis]|uniref:Imelysin family protein n=1 Tax=Aequorivita xiaoshiensis TaxID=2874476 RepID=A0A9X1R548_9FLAO|nr:imelysin family protein [Aequorivita xiaoshiensis]MCG2431917.1 imelysin family protein [Aequorivita xiaoshiensis]